MKNTEFRHFKEFTKTNDMDGLMTRVLGRLKNKNMWGAWQLWNDHIVKARNLERAVQNGITKAAKKAFADKKEADVTLREELQKRDRAIGAHRACTMERCPTIDEVFATARAERWSKYNAPKCDTGCTPLAQDIGDAAPPCWKKVPDCMVPHADILYTPTLTHDEKGRDLHLNTMVTANATLKQKPGLTAFLETITWGGEDADSSENAGEGEGDLPEEDQMVEMHDAQPHLAGYSAPFLHDKLFGLMEYRIGNLPLILSAPHAGENRHPDFQTRKSGCRQKRGGKWMCNWDQACIYDKGLADGGVLDLKTYPDQTKHDGKKCRARVYSDYNTGVILNLMSNRIYNKTGSRPYMIRNHIHRSKLDSNRAISEAAQGDVRAEYLWHAQRSFFGDARERATRDCRDPLKRRRAIFFELHGQAHTEGWTEFGYAIGKKHLNIRSDEAFKKSAAPLGGGGDNMETTIGGDGLFGNVNTHHSEGSTTSLDFADFIRGESSMGTQMMSDKFNGGVGYDSIPSKKFPGPHGGNYFSGGYNSMTMAKAQGAEGRGNGTAAKGSGFLEVGDDSVFKDKYPVIAIQAEAPRKIRWAEPFSVVRSYANALADTLIAMHERALGSDLHSREVNCPPVNTVTRALTGGSCEWEHGFFLRHRMVIALKGGNANKFCADGGSKVTCDRDDISSEAHFTVHHYGNGVVALKGGLNRQWCVDKGTSIECNRPKRQGKDLRFTYEQRAGKSISFRGEQSGNWFSDLGGQGVHTTALPTGALVPGASDSKMKFELTILKEGKSCAVCNSGAAACQCASRDHQDQCMICQSTRSCGSAGFGVARSRFERAEIDGKLELVGQAAGARGNKCLVLVFPCRGRSGVFRVSS